MLPTEVNLYHTWLEPDLDQCYFWATRRASDWLLAIVLLSVSLTYIMSVVQPSQLLLVVIT